MKPSAARPRFRIPRRSPPVGGIGTLEVVIILVTLAVLGLIAVPPYLASRDRARVEAVSSALRELSVSQEAFFQTHRRYAEGLQALGLEAPAGVEVRVVSAASAGWAARAVNRASGATCAVFYGTATAVSPATVPGVVTCER
jgi:Tfp pilus assembly protein PilE